MTFLYVTLLIVAAMIVLYIIGYAVAFCMLFCYFDKCESRHLKTDLGYAFASWFFVGIAALCWALEMEDKETSKQD